MSVLEIKDLHVSIEDKEILKVEVEKVIKQISKDILWKDGAWNLLK